MQSHPPLPVRSRCGQRVDLPQVCLQPLPRGEECGQHPKGGVQNRKRQHTPQSPLQETGSKVSYRSTPLLVINMALISNISGLNLYLTRFSCRAQFSKLLSSQVTNVQINKHVTYFTEELRQTRGIYGTIYWHGSQPSFSYSKADFTEDTVRG